MSKIAIFLVILNVWLVTSVPHKHKIDKHAEFENTLKAYKVIPDVLKDAKHVEKLLVRLTNKSITRF